MKKLSLGDSKSADTIWGTDGSTIQGSVVYLYAPRDVSLNYKSTYAWLLQQDNKSQNVETKVNTMQNPQHVRVAYKAEAVH